MSTLKEIRSEVKNNTGAKDPNFPPSRLNRIINLAQRYVQIQLNGLGMKKWEKSNVITAGLTADRYNSAINNVKKCPVNATYFPSILESPASITSIHVSDGLNYGVALMVDSACFYELLDNSYMSPEIHAPRFIRQDNYIWLAPVDITSATAYYQRIVADMVNDTDTTEIPAEMEEFCVRKAVLDIFEILDKTAKDTKAGIDADISTAFEKFVGKMNTEHAVTADKSKLVLQ